jgi:primosomal protein N'
MEAVRRTAEWHAAAIGSVLSQLLSPWIATDDLTSLPREPGSGFAVHAIECALPERKTHYRARIDENASRGRATLLVLPTLAEVEYWRKALTDLSPVVLTGNLKEGKRLTALQEAQNSTSLVIATPHFSFAQISALDTVIVERVGAGGFRLPSRPYLDMRIALLELARARDLRVIYGDLPLPLEYRAGARKLAAEGRVEVLDARVEREEGEVWRAVPKALLERIRTEVETGGRVAVLAARKGYAPVVICRDCGQALKDARGKTYAFFTEGGKRIFRTSDGASELATNTTCPNCSSWNLLPLGVGVERVFEELREAFADSPVVLFEADTVKTATGARRKLSDLNELGSIVVGTEAMVPWILAASPAPLSLAAVASADSLLALPFWRARERFLRLGFSLRALAPTAVVATRLPDDTAVKTLSNPDAADFFEEELMLRKALGYPPFGTLISLTWEGSQAALDKMRSEVDSAIAGYSARTIPDRFVHGTRYRRTIVLTLPKDTWPDGALSRSLSALPPSVRVLLDPESFW